jgi:hypothetical protein
MTPKKHRKRISKEEDVFLVLELDHLPVLSLSLSSCCAPGTVLYRLAYTYYSYISGVGGEVNSKLGLL